MSTTFSFCSITKYSTNSSPLISPRWPQKSYLMLSSKFQKTVPEVLNLTWTNSDQCTDFLHFTHDSSPISHTNLRSPHLLVSSHKYQTSSLPSTTIMFYSYSYGKSPYHQSKKKMCFFSWKERFHSIFLVKFFLSFKNNFVVWESTFFYLLCLTTPLPIFLKTIPI